MTHHDVSELLGWKTSQKNALGLSWVPNSADVASAESLRLATGVLEASGRGNPNVASAHDGHIPPRSPGKPLEYAVAKLLRTELVKLDTRRQWVINLGRSIEGFAQYEHLGDLNRLVANDPNLRVTIGTDYLIKPDVTVGIAGTPTGSNLPWLHAAIACKWTIRSDRVQNIRHENSNMIRHRRGRLPHLVTVTAEPLPTRLASIARGTGEVDTTYHIAYKALDEAVRRSGNRGQLEAWLEVTGQGRVRDFRLLTRSLVDW